MKTNLLHTNCQITNLVKLGQLSLAALVCLMAERSYAATTIFSEDFESYTDVATSLADTNSANPVRQFVNVTDDVPVGSPAGTGIQVINWDKHGGSKALLVRSGSTVWLEFPALTGSQYTWEFWTYIAREATTDRGFRVALQGEGSDINGDDFLAYRVELVAGSTAIQYYDGVGPGAAAWKKPGVALAGNAWQHHKIVINPNALTFSMYLDDMTTPVASGLELARSEVAAPVRIVLTHEGNTADDLHYIVDDISLTVENAQDLTATFTEGFEAYTARATTEDDADPAGSWITTEMDGTGTGRTPAPVKVQVVGPEAGITPHTGTKCLQLQGGQRAGVSFGFGIPTNTDLQITWWAKLPASPTGGEYNILRMSLYGVEAGSTYSGDNALLGYGCRNATVGDATSLTYYNGGWVDTQMDYTPDVWEEYRLTTHHVGGLYTIVKNPSSSPQILVDKMPMVGTAPFASSFMVGFSSSNGTNHPPVYVDDIEIKTLNASPDLTFPVYSAQVEGSRFTNVNMLNTTYPIAAVAIDPRDNSTIFFSTRKTGGAIYKASKVASGTWTIDPQPVVSGLDGISGLAVANDGALWWTHDATMSARRLKAPWASNTPEIMIADFGYLSGALARQDDDTYGVCAAPSGFTGTKGTPNDMIIMDRGLDADNFNALFTINSAETQTGVTNYQTFLVEATTTGLGALDLVSLAPFTSTEVATVNLDGQVSAVDANGSVRSFWPEFYRDTSVTPQPAGMTVDSKSGKVWIADDLTNQVWSCSTADGNGSQREVSFVVTNTAWANLNIDFPDSGLSFSKDGSILVVSDTGSSSGISRLIIMHNEPRALPAFKISSFSKTETGLQLTWEAAGAAKYRVQRTTDLKVPMVDITGDLTTTSFTDTNVPGGAFYRVVATQ